MKLLDRYVLVTFLKNYLISFFVLVGMYVVLDMIFQFDELVETNVRQGLTGFDALRNFLRTAGDYYFYQSFLYFAQLSGMITVVAAAFTLMRMARFNEMIPILTSGTPLVRVAMPMVLAALLLQGLLWVDQELLIPNMIPKLVRKHDYAAESDSFMISAMRDERNGKLFAGRYYPSAKPPRMDNPTIIYADDEDRVTEIAATSATWDAPGRRWLLTNGRVSVYERGTSSGRATTQPAISVYQSDITPEEVRLFRSGNFVELLSTSRINELLQRPKSYGRVALLRVKHARGPAQFSLNMILLLLAISSVLSREPQQIRTAALKCVMWTGACLTAAFAAQELAGYPSIPSLADKWPALMAWAPVFLFGPIAVLLLARVKT